MLFPMYVYTIMLTAAIIVMLELVCLSSDITVGFDVNSTDSNGTEGEAVSLCIQSYDGMLGPNITLDYLIEAPREVTLLPFIMDTAIGMYQSVGRLSM